MYWVTVWVFWVEHCEPCCHGDNKRITVPHWINKLTDKPLEMLTVLSSVALVSNITLTGSTMLQINRKKKPHSSITVSGFLLSVCWGILIPEVLPHLTHTWRVWWAAVPRANRHADLLTHTHTHTHTHCASPVVFHRNLKQGREWCFHTKWPPLDSFQNGTKLSFDTVGEISVFNDATLWPGFPFKTERSAWSTFFNTALRCL